MTKPAPPAARSRAPVSRDELAPDELIEKPQTSSDLLNILTLCVELQLDALMVALRPGASAPRRTAADAPPIARTSSLDSPLVPRWPSPTLDLTRADEEGVPGMADWLVARYEALVSAVDEVLGSVHEEVHPGLVTRLHQARDTCAARLRGLQASTGSAAPDTGERQTVEAGHYLG